MPLSLVTKSMYQPGGAIVGSEGTFSFSTPGATRRDLTSTIRCSVSTECVTADGRMRLTHLMSLDWDVWIWTVSPYPTWLGAWLMTGRVPWNRYGGEYNSSRSSASIPGGLDPPTRTRPSGSSNAKEWYMRAMREVAACDQALLRGL